jgi:hypothetical protein
MSGKLSALSIRIMHCNENSIYVFLFWELRGLGPNFHIHVSVSDLYTSRICPHISCGRTGRSIVVIYKSLTDTILWKLGLWPRNSFTGNICFEFSVLVLCSVEEATSNNFIVSIISQYHLFTEDTGEEAGSNQPPQLATSNNINNNNKRVEENKDATVDASNLPKGINRLSRESILLMNRTHS